MHLYKALDKQTLVILTPAFPANESPEETVWLPAQQALVRALNRQYPAVEIVLLSFQFPLQRKEYRWHGNTVIPFGGGNRGRGRNWWVWVEVFNTLRRLQRTRNVAGLLSFWWAECAFVGGLFARAYGLPHYCWLCGQDARAGNRFVKRLRPKPGELVAMSDFLQRSFAQHYGIRPAHLIPDAIDTRLFAPFTGPRDIDLMAAGGLSPLKQFDMYVELVQEVKVARGSIHAVLCGGGLEEEKLRQQSVSLGLTSGLQLTGYLPQREVLALMQRTKVFLHTSSYEGFGNVCIEALYAGAHVISFIQPMDAAIPHWHIVKTKAEMLEKALALLGDNGNDYTPILPFDINDTARSFMQLFESSSTTSQY